MVANVTDLLAKIKRLGGLPESQERLSDDVILDFANEELSNSVYPLLLSINEEYALVKEIIPLRTNTNQSIYPTLTIPIPSRAYGRTLRELKYIDESSNLINIPYLAMNDEDILQDRDRNTLGFYFMSDAVQLLGGIENLGSSLLAHYIVEPDKLINLPNQFSNVTNMSLSMGTTIIDATVSVEMDLYCPVGGRRLFDIMRRSSGALLAVNIPMIRTTNSEYTTTVLEQIDINAMEAFQTAGFSGLIAPSFYDPELIIVPSGQSPFTHIPRELDDVLVWHVISRIMFSLGDSETFNFAERQKEMYAKNAVKVLGNRIQGEAQKITNRRGFRAYMRNVSRRLVRP